MLQYQKKIGNRAVLTMVEENRGTQTVVTTMVEEDREQSCCYNGRGRPGTELFLPWQTISREQSFCYKARRR